MFPHKARRKSVGVRVTALGKIRKRKLRRQRLVSRFMTRHRSLRQRQRALRRPRALGWTVVAGSFAVQLFYAWEFSRGRWMG